MGTDEPSARVSVPPVIFPEASAVSAAAVTLADAPAPEPFRPSTVAPVSTFMPAIAAGAKSILFGDLGYYWVADRQGRSFKRLNELFAATGQVGFLSSERVDGKLILPEAVKVLAQKAA